MGGHPLQSQCCVGPSKRDLMHYLLGCTRAARSDAPGVPVATSAGPAATVVARHRVPVPAPGPAHGGRVGCESERTLPPSEAVPQRLSWRTLGMEDGQV